MAVCVQVCMTCIRCKSCGITPGKSWDTEWNHDKGLCSDCSKLFELGEERTCVYLMIWHFYCPPAVLINVSLIPFKHISFSLGNYCPICFKCYEDNDYDSQMMQCGTCNHWVHAKCEDLTGDCFYLMCLSGLKSNATKTVGLSSFIATPLPLKMYGFFHISIFHIFSCFS